MANITTCTECGKAYEAGSNEEANEPVRYCWKCWRAHKEPGKPCEACGGDGVFEVLEDGTEIACIHCVPHVPA